MTMKNTVFALCAHELETQDNGKSLPKVGKDLSVKVWDHDLGIFTTREKAEKMIADWLEHVKDWNLLILGFTIVEKQVDTSFGGKFSEISKFEGSWAYDGNGSMLCDSPYDDGCTIPFKGRKTGVKTKVGDIVFVRYPGGAMLALAVQLPPTESWWKKNMKEDASGDCTDDSYTTVAWNCGHEHPRSVSVFPYVGIPSKEVERKLWSEFKRYARDCGLSKDSIPLSRHELANEWWK